VQKVVQQSLERAAQRAAKGKKMRAKGSQPKMLLDTKKNAADKTKSRLSAMQDNRLNNIEETLSNLEKQQSVTKAQHIYLNSSELNKDYTLLTVKDWQCKYVNGPCVSFTVKQMSRIWLKGSNGTGKSTLLNTLRASRSDSPNVMYKNCEITYLDQHYSWLDNFSSSLDALMTISDSLTVQQARTLLAGIGFKGDTVFTNTSYLSGGERMKVAMLCTSYAKNNALLLLDEPDNHLDLDSKNQLANALSQYKGAFILVSHDSDFVNAVDINTIVDINLIEPIVVTK
jgi:ATPase subunit of ABC transporter with duplicated ATPase domains